MSALDTQTNSNSNSEKRNSGTKFNKLILFGNCFSRPTTNSLCCCYGRAVIINSLAGYIDHLDSVADPEEPIRQQSSSILPMDFCSLRRRKKLLPICSNIGL